MKSRNTYFLLVFLLCMTFLSVAIVFHICQKILICVISNLLNSFFNFKMIFLNLINCAHFSKMTSDVCYEDVLHDFLSHEVSNQMWRNFCTTISDDTTSSALDPITTLDPDIDEHGLLQLKPIKNIFYQINLLMAVYCYHFAFTDSK